MANPFDQFDEVQKAQENPFDQFDTGEPKKRATSPRMARAEAARDERTRAVRELPELPVSGLLAGEDQSKIALIGQVLTTATKPEEVAQILSESFPNIGIQYDEQGNILAANNATGARAVINKPGFTVMDALQAVGIGAAFTPAGRAATVPAAIARSALTETAMQAGQSAAGGEFNAEDVALSAAFGGAGKAAENLISGGVRAARGAIPEEQAALIAEAEKRGIPLTTTDVVPNETIAGRMAQRVGEAIPFVGMGQVRQGQQRAREAAIEDVVASAKPQYEEVVQSLKTQTDKVRKAAGNRLDLITGKMDEVGEISPINTLSEIDKALADLTAKGRVVDEQSVRELQRYREAILEGQTFRSLDTLRSDFREGVKGDRQLLPTRSEAMINRVYNAMTSDLKGSIRSNLGDKSAEGWSNAKGIYAREANIIKKSRLKSVLDKGDVTPESVGNIIFSQKPSEIRNLYRSLTPEGKEAMRGTILAKAVEKATNAEGVVTPTALATQLGKMKKQTDITFRGLKGKEIKGLTDVLNATRRAQEAPVLTPTGQTFTGFAGGYAAYTDLATTAGFGLTSASLARAYESPLVRNALLRVASVPKGTDAYDNAISEAVKLITSFGQVAKDENIREAAMGE